MEQTKTIYFATRYFFWVTILFWIINSFMNYETLLELVFGYVWLGLIITTFILSIIHLTKYPKKGFAVTSLVIMSYLLLTFFIGLIIGVMSYA